MNRPPLGLCLPCNFRRCRDADTIEVSIPGSERVWAIRLLECWAPESNTGAGKQAKAYVETLLKDETGLYVWIPCPRDPTHIFKDLITFDRILAHIFIDSENSLSEMIVRAGHALKNKPENK